MNMSKNKIEGFTLIEMMISITIASLLSLAVVNTFVSQSSMFTVQAQRNQMASDGFDAHELLSRLLQQAESSSIVITNSGTTRTIDFTVPSGFPIWPNNTSPFTNNAIRLQWDSTGSNPNQIRIASAENVAGLGVATLATLVGDSNGSNTQISNLALTLNGGIYQLSLTARAGSGGPSTTFQGSVIPRNW